MAKDDSKQTRNETTPDLNTSPGTEKSGILQDTPVTDPKAPEDVLDQGPEALQKVIESASKDAIEAPDPVHNDTGNIYRDGIKPAEGVPTV